MHAGVRVERLVCVDRVGEPQLFANALKEARAHSAAEQHAEQQKRKTLRVAVRHGTRSRDDVRLRAFTLDVVRARRLGARRLGDERRSGRRPRHRANRCPTARPTDARADVARRGDDQVCRMVGAAMQ